MAYEGEIKGQRAKSRKQMQSVETPESLTFALCSLLFALCFLSWALMLDRHLSRESSFSRFESKQIHASRKMTKPQ